MQNQKIMPPKVSIVMAVKNAEPYLSVCIDSILSQTFTDFELLCIMDASTDKTWEILCSYQNSDSRVSVVEGDNNGPGGARNKGISIARGKYWAFLDSDDIFEHHMLERLYATAEKNVNDIVICYSRRTNMEGQSEAIADAVRLENLPSEVIFSCFNQPSEFLESFSGWAWDKLFRSDFCKRHRLQFGDNYIFEDAAFVYSALAIANRITIVRENLIFHRVHPSSLEATAANFNLHWTDILLNVSFVQSKLMECDRYLVLKASFVRVVLNYMLWALRRTSGDSFNQMIHAIDRFISDNMDVSSEELRRFSYREDFWAYKKLKMLQKDSRWVSQQKALIWTGRQLIRAGRYLLEGRSAEIFDRIRSIAK